MIIGLSGKIGSGKDTFALMLKAAISEAKTPDTWKEFIGVPYLEPNLLEKLSGYQTKRWAGALKQIVAILIGCTIEQLEDRNFKDSYLGPEWWYYRPTEVTYPYLEIHDMVGTPGLGIEETDLVKPTVRQLLQEVGTNAIREVIHPNAWINALMSQYKPDLSNEDKIRRDFGDKKGNINWQKAAEKLPNWIIPDTRFPNEADAIKQKGGLVIRIERSLQDWEKEHRVLTMHKEHSSETRLDDYKDFDVVIHNDSTIEDLYEKARDVVYAYQLHK